MAVGPVDVYVIGFPGNKFNGQVAPALLELVENDIIRVIDLLFIMKDVDGNIAVIEIEDLDPDLGPAFMEVDIIQPGALGAEDAEEIAEDIPAGSSALLIAFENYWATKIVSALAASDAVVIDQIRIPTDVVAQAITAG